MAKAVPQRIFSIAVHPCEDKLIVLTGDKNGYLGLFDVDNEDPEQCVVNWRPHVRPLSSIHIQPDDGSKVG